MIGNKNVNELFLVPVRNALEAAGLLDEVKTPAVSLSFGFIQFGIEWQDGIKDFHLTEVNLNEVKPEKLKEELGKAAALCAQDLIGKKRARIEKETCLCGHHADSHELLIEGAQLGTGPCHDGTCLCDGFKAKV